MAAILIYAPRQSNRLRYVLQEIFHSRLGIGFELTSDPGHLSSGPCICYTSEPPGLPGICIPASTDLLFETGQTRVQAQVITLQDIPALFPAEGRADAWQPFDLFATVFFLLSRYEEYQPFTPDAHGRFPASASLASRYGFLEVPLADIWVNRLGDALKEVFPSLPVSRPPFSFLPTIDVDQMWAFRHKPLWRQAGGLLLDCLHGRWRKALQRLSVWAGRERDPFDTFDFLEAQHSETRPVFFFLAGDPGPFDVNNPAHSPTFGKVVRNVAKHSEIGIHPSYRSAGKPEPLQKEKRRLEQISGREIAKSRQHFLLLRFPATYRRLLDAGIREDYSMGFADAPGFRAGTSVPFEWYDLEAESPTELRIIPFQIMDVTLRQYLQLVPEAALARIRPILMEVYKNGGLFASIWHNSSFDESGEWKGWTQVYTNLLKEIFYLYDKADTAHGT